MNNMHSCYTPWYRLGEQQYNWCCDNPGYMSSCYESLGVKVRYNGYFYKKYSRIRSCTDPI